MSYYFSFHGIKKIKEMREKKNKLPLIFSINTYMRHFVKNYAKF